MVSLLTASASSQSVAPGVITNRLDEEQDRLLSDDDNRCRSMTLDSMPSRKDYVFRPPSIDERLRLVAGQSLLGWITGSEATTPQALATPEMLRDYYLSDTRSGANGTIPGTVR